MLRSLKLDRGRMLFMAGRIVGLVCRPLALWICMRAGYLDVSVGLSYYLVFVGSFLMLFNSAAHIELYSAMFGANPATRTRQSRLAISYLYNLISHIAYFLIIGLVIAAFRGEHAWRTILWFVILLFEKYFDELQRYCLYSRNFARWGVVFIAKTVLPLLGAIPLSVCFGIPVAVSVAGLLAATAAVCLFRYTPRSWRARLVPFRSRVFRKHLNRYRQFYIRQNLLVQVLSFTSANVINLDKWSITAFGSESALPEVMLLSQLGTSLLICVDNCYFSTRRADLLVGHSEGRRLFDWAGFVKFSVLAFLGYVAASCCLLRLWPRVQHLSYDLLFLYGLCYLAHTLCLPAAEYLFWHSGQKLVLACDLAFAGAFAVTLFLGSPASLNQIALAFLAGATVRLAALSFCRLSVEKRHDVLCLSTN